MAEGAITSQGQPVTEAHDHDHQYPLLYHQ